MENNLKNNYYINNAVHNAADKPAVKSPKGVIYCQSKPEPYPGTGRNAKCPCGSGRKYKQCCLNRV